MQNRFRSLVICLLISLFGFSQSAHLLDADRDHVLIEQTDLFSDTTNSMSLEEVMAVPDEQWNQGILAKYSQDLEWIRLQLVNNADQDIEKVLYLSNPISHEVDVYLIQGEFIEHIPSGLARTSKNKLFNDPGYPYLISVPANSKMELYLQTYDPLSSMQVPVHLLNPKAAESFKDTNLTLLFFWLGVLTLSVVIAVLMYMNTRQLMFVYYCLFAIATGIIISSTTGMITMFIDSDPYQIVTNYYQWGAILLILFMPRFLDSLVPVNAVMPRVWRVVRVLGFVGVGIAVLYSIPYFKFSFFFTKVFINCVVGLTALTFLYLLVALAIASIRRLPRAFPLFVVYLIYLSLAFVNIIFPLFGTAESSLNSAHYVMLGSALEIMAFMIFMGQAAFMVYKDRQELLEQVRDHQDEVMQALVKGQEDERNRFARDLHDGFGGMISALNLNLKGLNSVKSTDTEKRIDVFNTSSDILKNMHAELKNICFDLMPQTLVKHGLEAGIRELANRINASDQKLVEVNVFGLEERLTEIQEISIYRIVQEWINNILKHSDAKTISVQITKDHEEVTLLIEDDGMGFDKNLLLHSKGNGWKNLNSRANLISGELELDTYAGMRGNTLILNATLAEARHERQAYLEGVSK